MSFGMRIWDGVGDLVLDASDRTGSYVATYTVPQIPPREGYSLSIPGYTAGTWYFSGEIGVYLDVTQNDNGLYFFNTHYSSPAPEFQLVVYRS